MQGSKTTESMNTLEAEMSPLEQQCIKDVLDQKKFTGKHLEIGTAAGGTLCNMLVHYRDGIGVDPLPPFMVIDTMDYFPGQVKTIRQNLMNHGLDPDSIHFVQSPSRQAFLAALEKPPEFDFILIDANHKLRYVIQDLRWAQFIKPGGVLAIHEFSQKFPGVLDSVNRFLRRNPHYKILQQGDSLVALEKGEGACRPEVSKTDILRAEILGPLMDIWASIKKRLFK
jgi:predicted O-methyltransferase YrrM